MITYTKHVSFKGKRINKKLFNTNLKHKENPILKALMNYKYKPFEFNDKVVKEGFRVDVIDFKKCKGYFLKSTAEENKKVVLQIHGGGYVLPMNDTNFQGAYLYNKYLGADVLLVDYRVDEKFPAAIEDVCEAYDYLLTLYDPKNIIVAGHSAGGGLAVALLIHLREKELPLPKFSAIASPWLDLKCTGITYLQNRLVDVTFGCFFKQDILPNRYADDEYLESIYASPMYDKLTDLGEVIVICGKNEMLLSDTLTFEEKNKKINVIIYEGMWHDFYTKTDAFKEAKSAWKNIKKFEEDLNGR